MRVWPFPKSWLIHTIEYREITDQLDDWDNPVFADPITIEHVRFDDATEFSRDTTQTRVLADAIIYVDARNSSPVPNFKEESIIAFRGRELVIKKVVPCYYPNKNEVHHWELEVI